MKVYIEKAYQGVTKLLPADVAGRVDLLMRPSYRASWGGPLNGQERRREIVRDLARAVPFDRVLETGTYRGTSTEFFAAVIGSPVQTVEGDPRLFSYSQHRLAAHPEVVVELGDSRTFLRRLSEQPAATTETVFIYLDAHWLADLPLSDELRIIAPAWPRAVVMIDDFQVPDDPGYRYDDYGPGRALVEEYLPADALTGWSLYYPSATSAQETGAKRGCCVLASPALAPAAGVPTLRKTRTI